MWGISNIFCIFAADLQFTIHNSQFTKGDKSMYGLGVLGEKIEAFTKRVVKATKYIKEQKEYSLADQFFRSGTSIGANCSEAVSAVSKADFANKLSIALKEANETCHWIDVMFYSELIDKATYESMSADAREIMQTLNYDNKKHTLKYRKREEINSQCTMYKLQCTRDLHGLAQRFKIRTNSKC